MVVTCNWQNQVYTHVEFTVGEEEKAHRIAGPEMDFDGDGTYTFTAVQRQFTLLILQ